MAIVRSAGTEIIRSHTIEAVNSTPAPMIIGVQHHIYTILSIVCYAVSMNTTGNWVSAYLVGWDNKAGASGENIEIFRQEMSTYQTFIWNDKFSINGAEPTGFTGGLTTAAEQDAIADQGTTTAQTLYVYTQHASDNVDVICTFIDQNNE